MTNEESIKIMCERCTNHTVCQGTGCTPKQVLEQLIYKESRKKKKSEGISNMLRDCGFED